MSIQVTIPLESLRSNTTVAVALQALLDALATGGRRRPGRPRAAAPATVTARAKSRATRSTMKPRGKQKSGSSDLAKKLVAHLGEKGATTLVDLKKVLGLRDGKAVGGLVGSHNRWARLRGGPRIMITPGGGGERLFEFVKE